MKKLALLFAAFMAISVSAQTVTESKTFDNIYIGINGGVATKTTGHKWLSDLNPNAGLRIGRYFTPVFGLAIESNAYFSNNPYKSFGTIVRGINTSLLGTINFSNWFGGYKGEPRIFEVSGVYGLGWAHTFTNKSDVKTINAATSKVGLDFAFNLGKSKAWQFYIEPSINYALNGTGYNGIEYNINKSMVQLNAGLIYKFKNFNGTHNFTSVVPRDQAEIDALNAQINELRSRQPKVVTKEVIKEVPAESKQFTVSNLVFVTFAQGKYTLTNAAKDELDKIKDGSHVQIVGTASPEGSASFNQRLSENRAKVVANYLSQHGVVVDKAIGKGVQGVTSNRLAVVYIK